MRITIDGTEFEVYFGTDRESDWVETESGKEWVTNSDEGLEEFFEAIGNTKGRMFCNYPFSGDTVHYYGGDVPCYYLNEFKYDDEDETYETNFEEIRKEVFRMVDANKDVYLIFEDEEYNTKAYVSDDGCFHLKDVEDMFSLLGF